MASELIRIEQLSEAERTLIGLLSPAERRDALLSAAQSRQRRMNEQLLHEHIQRVLRGEIAPQTATEDGRPYPTNGRTVYFQNEQEPMEDIGRVPGHTGIHVLRRGESLEAINGFSLRRKGEIWEELDGSTT